MPSVQFVSVNNDRFDSWERHPAEREGIPYDDATA